MEKAIVVVVNLTKASKNGDAARAEALQELQQHLDAGWRVKQSSGMSGTDHFLLASLVILERDD